MVKCIFYAPSLQSPEASMDQFWWQKVSSVEGELSDQRRYSGAFGIYFDMTLPVSKSGFKR